MKAISVLVFIFSLWLCGCQSPCRTSSKISSPESPSHFWFDYPYQPLPGKRYWNTSDHRVWIRNDENVRVLLSSEVGSEGIDLQFCHVVINYDLPWNPMRIAQRIGRIDRVGQQAEKLVIVHFKVRDTIEERLYPAISETSIHWSGARGNIFELTPERIHKDDLNPARASNVSISP